MYKSKLLKIIILIIVIAFTATTVLANPYYMESRGEFMDEIFGADPSASGNSHLCTKALTKEEATQYPFCWWRDTSAQNALSSTADIYAQVLPVYHDDDLDVLVYISEIGPNVTAIIGSSEMLLVGAGGSRAGANNAKLAFQNYYAGFTGKKLKGIILLDPSWEQSYGVTYWRSIFHYTPQVPMIVSDAYDTVRNKREVVAKEYEWRLTTTYGMALTWGEDGFLGLGAMKQYRPNLSSYISPNINDIFVSTLKLSGCGGSNYTGGINGVNITVNGIPVRIVGTSDADAGLLVYLNRQNIVITRDGGRYLPDVGSYVKPNVTFGEQGKALAWALHPAHMGQFTENPGSWYQGNVNDSCSGSNGYPLTSTETLVSTYGLPIIGAADVYNALTVQRDALKYLHDETLKYINYGLPLQDILTTVTLSPLLANSPYTQEFVGTQENIIRSVYHEYLGWYEGDVAELVTLSSLEESWRTVDAMGGEKAMLKTAKDAITEHSLQGAKWALKLTSILRQVLPSDEANDIYIQALKMLAFSTKNAYERNYFLDLAYRARIGE
jgi:hypothetical protein